MKEQSHKDEMSKALRGDFERLRERGVPTTFARQDEPAPVETAEPTAVDEETPEPVTGAVAASPPGWLDRVLGRG